MARRLRSGYTTGACAAAAAKAAAILATGGGKVGSVELIFPDASRHRFSVWWPESAPDTACVTKDAGDDPDVTNRAAICAKACLEEAGSTADQAIVMDNIRLYAGAGIGRVTKPGLAVAVGEPAINPVPREMICQAVREVEDTRPIELTISVPDGERLAEKTLNHRLGIVGGLSILGTTGIVRPVSAEAWTATIEASMNVAREAGLKDIVLSTGRTSEKGAQSLLDFPVEAYAMMGDYLGFSLTKAGEKGFDHVHLAGMWAKVMKAALHIPQTHVRNGALEIRQAAELLKRCGARGELLTRLESANTAREMYTLLREDGRDDIVRQICCLARDYGSEIAGRKVSVYLIDAKAKVVEHV